MDIKKGSTVVVESRTGLRRAIVVDHASFYDPRLFKDGGWIIEGSSDRGGWVKWVQHEDGGCILEIK